MYGEVKKDIGEIQRKLCEMSEAELIEGKVCSDHVHLYCNTSKAECIEVYVVTVGNVNESTIVEYIREQEENDKLEK